MRPVALFFTLVTLAAVGIGIYYFFRRKRDGPTLPRHSYPSSSFNSGATSIQTQQVYRPPLPSPSYTRSSYPSPATYAYSQTAPRTPAPPDHGRGVYHSSVAPSYTRTPSQTQPSSTHIRPSSTLTQPSSALTRPSSALTRPSSAPTRPSSTLTQPSSTLAWPSSTLTQPSSTLTQASRQHSSLFSTVHVDEPPPEYEYFRTSSRVPSRVHTGSEPRLPTVIHVVSSDSRSDEPASVEGLDFAEKLRE